MRIEFTGAAFTPASGEMDIQQLFKLLLERDRLMALITRMSSGSLVLEIDGKEFKLPRAFFIVPCGEEALAPGGMIEIERRGETTLAFTVLDSDLEMVVAPPEQAAFSSLEAHLSTLGISHSAGAVLVARALLERGYPLERELVLALVPWAERGELTEALILLQARFPLRRGLVQVVQSLTHRPPVAERIAAINELPPDLRQALAAPSSSIADRTAWSSEFTEGETFKALCRLLVQERLLEAVAVQAGGGELVLAFPFVLAHGLYACWARFYRADRGDGREEMTADWRERPLHIELEIPTTALGVVGVRLVVAGQNLTLSLQVEGEEKSLWRQAAEELKQELAANGWRLGAVEIGRWSHAKSSSFALRAR